LKQYRITVFPRQAELGQSPVLHTAHQLGVHALTDCSTARIFFIGGDLNAQDAERIAQELVADPITEGYIIGDIPATHDEGASHVVEVTLLAGVTDPAAESLLRAIQRLSIQAQQTATGLRYSLFGALSGDDVRTLAERVLANGVIQRYDIDRPAQPPFLQPSESDGFVEVIALCDADDDALLNISKARRLSLDLNEMRAIQAYYRQEGREPRDTELETLAQTWSEHCVHKTFRATIDFTDANGAQETIHGLLKTHIRAATEALAKPFVRSAFVDNAGIVAFDDTYDLAFKVETHNHPSALEPFGGANTGVGGVVRDVLGVSARPIANTDILLFGHEDAEDASLPQGVLHPRRIQSGVIAGIEDYGNKMGIPTVNGAILYDAGYTANPLVFCGCLGILPHGSHVNVARDGDYIVVIGGRTGRDGLRGATFSSMEMDTTTSDIASVSVQIGHPINEKQVQEVILRARDEKLYNAITDCGAGGLSSAVGEMGKDLGAEVELATVLLKYAGLRPWEIWLSEAQERMVLAVAPEHWERLCELAKGQDVEITRIGTYKNTGRLVLTYHGQNVGELDMHFLHEGIPTRHLKAHWQAPATQEASLPNAPFSETLLRLLAHPNIRSKEQTVRLYDHEVQGGTVIKPFIGAKANGGSNGAVLVPFETKHTPQPDGGIRGVAVSNGINPYYGKLDPYAMAWACVDEAFRNLVAIGADPDQVSILDNFCWGNPNLPDRLGSLVLASKGCHDAALAYGAPFISGKDSLNNEYASADGTRHAIPGTLLISAIGIVPDVRQTVNHALKGEGNALYLIGETRPELGGSHVLLLDEREGGIVPQPNPRALDTLRALHHAIKQGWIQACHDLSEGGLAVSVAEMCIAGNLGAQLSAQTPEALFAESSTRFIVEVTPEHSENVVALFSHIARIGTVTSVSTLTIGQESVSLQELERAYRGHVLSPTPAQTLALPAVDVPMPKRVAKPHTRKPRALILHANGTNRDRDASLALELAGAEAEIVHVNQLKAGERRLLDYQMLIIPGGFSYGDDLGAGQLWAQDLRHDLRDDVERFVREGRPVLGICNGFQVLMKSGLLPMGDFASGAERLATLTYNERGHFECRWVTLEAVPNSVSLFTEGMSERIFCPVAHGEGRVIVRDEASLHLLARQGQIALLYTEADGAPAGYPANPNGSVANIAALCNPQGNVMGLMPHPENHLFAWQRPDYPQAQGLDGLLLFKNAVKYS
jgi:phosphoribosylformylglycinamidine synthase